MHEPGSHAGNACQVTGRSSAGDALTLSLAFLPCPALTTHSCSKKILYYLNRSWSAKDRAGNVGSRSSIIGVVDDQQPVPTVTSVVFSKHPKYAGVVRAVTLSIRPLPNKNYRWQVMEGFQESKRIPPRSVIKTGGLGTWLCAAPAGAALWCVVCSRVCIT